MHCVFREWSKQQISEQLQEEANLKQAKRLSDLKQIENDQRAAQLAQAEQQCRRAINMATKDFNAALAKESAAKRDTERRQEEDDNKTEILNSVFGDMLTEDPAVAQSAFGSHRVITDRWKGMSPSELNEIRHTQNQQLLEKKVHCNYLLMKHNVDYASIQWCLQGSVIDSNERLLSWSTSCVLATPVAPPMMGNL